MNVMTEGKHSKLNLTPREKHILGDYILKHCTVPEGRQFAVWDMESGGSDMTVADRLRPDIPKITFYHVRNLRVAFGLALEPTRLVWVKQRQAEKLTELDQLRDKVEALVAHVKECDVRLKDYGERIRILESEDRGLDLRLTTLEDKYTSPKR